MCKLFGLASWQHEWQTNMTQLFQLTMAANLVKSMLPLESRKPGSWAPAAPFWSLPPPRPPAKPWAGNPNGKPGKPPPGPGKPAAERSEAGQGQLSPGSGPRPESREAVPLPRWPASKQIALCLISTLSLSHDIMWCDRQFYMQHLEQNLQQPLKVWGWSKLFYLTPLKKPAADPAAKLWRINCSQGLPAPATPSDRLFQNFIDNQSYFRISLMPNHISDIV